MMLVLTFFGRRLQESTQNKEPRSDYLVFSFKITTLEAMTDGEEGTTKYSEGSKREAKPLF
jgi:hypothetical protein